MLVLPAALVVVAWSGAVWVATHASTAIDLGVYRTAVSVWRHGMPVYGPGYPFGLGEALPFTYPPFGLLPFSILAALPMTVAFAAMIALGLLAVAVTTRMAWGSAWSGTTGPTAASAPTWTAPIRSASIRPTSIWAGRPAPAVLVVLGMSAAFEPVTSSFYFGQVNLILMVLIAADALLPRTPWPRGLLIGLCAAIKLTPLAFLLFFLARRDWRAMAWTVGTFLLATGVAAAVLPRDSATYWFSVVFDSGRVGSVDFAANQSLRAVIFRLGAGPTEGLVLWVLAVAVVLGGAFMGVRARHRRDDELGALVVTAAAGLLVSPVSWNHHYVWCVPGLVWLVRQALGVPTAGATPTAPVARTAWLVTPAPAALTASRASRASRAGGWWAATALTLLVFVVGPYRYLPNGNDRELAWTWWQHLAGDAYVWAAGAIVAWAAYDAWRSRASPVPARG